MPIDLLNNYICPYCKNEDERFDTQGKACEKCGAEMNRAYGGRANKGGHDMRYND